MGRISKLQNPENHGNRTLTICIWLLLVLISCISCSQNGVRVNSNESIEIEQTQLQESSLLDVGIIIFDAGQISKDQKEKDGITPEIRAAEARYISYHLRQTMQKASGWGSINILPSESEISDVIVRGEIIESNGEELKLKIGVKDSIGNHWFEKTYYTEVTRRDWVESDRDVTEIFQAMYNRIANDVYRHRKKLNDEQSIAIRNTSELKYATNLAPDIYADYISLDAQGKATINRLPAIDDPSLLRVKQIREREFLLVNTINEHYGNYYDQVHDTYASWRKYYLLETLQKRKVEREARMKKALGGAAVVGAILIAVLGGDASPALIAAGVATYQDGARAAEEAVIHKEAIIELSQSLQADVEPLVVEVDGEALALTGTLDEQYVQWRSLLKEIYEEDIGLPLDAPEIKFKDS